MSPKNQEPLVKLYKQIKLESGTISPQQFLTLPPLWPEENKCNYPSGVWESTVNMTYYPNSHFSRERAQPDIAERLTFWWLKQKEVYLLTSQEVQRGQPRDKAVAQPMRLFSLLPHQHLGFRLHACHVILSQQELADSQAHPGLRFTFKVGSSLHRGERMKQLLKNKRRQKKVPPAQVLSLPDLPNTQQIPIHTFLTTTGILKINVSHFLLSYL